MDQFETIQDRYNLVMDRISHAANSVDRDPDRVRLLVVTKGKSLETVKAVVAAGARCLGENYVEDAISKIERLEDPNVDWHMIGHVQSRKAKQVCQHFSCMHSLDRMKIARRMNRFAGEMGKIFPVLIECNLSGEETKFGYPLWDESKWPEFANEVASLIDFTNLKIKGLMTMPPYHHDPENSRPYFQKQNRLRDFLAGHFPQVDWRELSMGMSNDYEVAVQEGATIVRVGTAILGQRK
jgi:pyridoxal phosphate enzyme (YggS family)